MKIIGIDNGLGGAIAGIEFTNISEDPQHGKISIYWCYDMPLTAKNDKWTYDEKGIADLLLRHKPDYAYIERAQAFHKQGVTSTFSFALRYGLMRGILSGLGIQYEVVEPKKWQSFFFKKAKDDNTKEIGSGIASKLFPMIDLKTKKGRLLDGRSDALLIAEYGRCKILGVDKRSCGNCREADGGACTYAGEISSDFVCDKHEKI